MLSRLESMFEGSLVVPVCRLLLRTEPISPDTSTKYGLLAELFISFTKNKKGINDYTFCEFAPVLILTANMAAPRIPPKVYKYRGNHKPKFATTEKDVYFRDILPLRLKDKIIGRDTNAKNTPCVGQLLDMMDCLKRTGFSEAPCKQQILSYKNCNEKFKKDAQVKQARAEEDISLVRSTRDMKRDQVNRLLKKFHTKS